MGCQGCSQHKLLLQEGPSAGSSLSRGWGFWHGEGVPPLFCSVPIPFCCGKISAYPSSWQGLLGAVCAPPGSLSPPVPCMVPALGGSREEMAGKRWQGACYSGLCPTKGVFIHWSHLLLLLCAEPRVAEGSPLALAQSRVRKGRH